MRRAAGRRVVLQCACNQCWRWAAGCASACSTSGSSSRVLAGSSEALPMLLYRTLTAALPRSVADVLMTSVTRILVSWSNETDASKGRVVAALYDELRRIARMQLRREGPVVDLQPTSLVNEAYCRLVNLPRMDRNGRSHFLAMAGRVMREVLVDEARRMRAARRDQALQTRLTGEWAASDDMPVLDVLEIDRLLHELEAVDPDYVKLVVRGAHLRRHGRRGGGAST